MVTLQQENEVVSQPLINGDCDQITASLRQALRANAFANRMLLAPRRLNELGAEETQNFLAFLTSRDADAVVERGKQLALEGLGHTSVLGVSTALRLSCLNSNSVSPGASSLVEAAEYYTSALLQGYMQGREDELRREQELTRAAYLRTLD